MPDGTAGLSPEQTAALFPFFLECSCNRKAGRVGPSLQKLLPHAAPGFLLQDHFRLKRPDGNIADISLKSLVGRLIILEELSGKFLLRGQIVSLDGDRWMFLGSPWITDPAELKTLGLTLTDFALHDPVIDLVQLIQLQKSSLGDTKTLAARLKEKADQFLRLNEELERQYQALKDAEAMNRTILSNAAEGIIAIDEHGSILLFNPAAEVMFGYTETEMIGKNVTCLMPEPHRSHHNEYIANYIRRGFSKIIGSSHELEAVRRNGSRFPIDLSVGESQVADSKRIFTGFVRDVSLRKQAEAAVQRIRAHEAEIGGRIQRTLLSEPPIRHLQDIQIAMMSIPSREVDGDFVDFGEYESGLDVLVGDVMGKGVPAALLGAATKNQFLRARAELIAKEHGDHAGCEPSEVFNRVHRALTPQMIRLETFATACLARFDSLRREARFVNAGHPLIIHYTANTGKARFFDPGNSPLGFFETEVYQQYSCTFGPGDVFVFYSDGVTEARSPDGEELGPDALLDLVQTHGPMYPQRLLDVIQQSITDFVKAETFLDDITCVVIRIDDDPGPALVEETLALSSNPERLEEMRDFLQRFLSRHAPEAMTEDEFLAFQLAVDEAATNIMLHAYSGERDRPLDIDVKLYLRLVRVGLRHKGAAFEAKCVDPPAFDGSRSSGFGLYLIDKGADEIRYLGTLGDQELRLGKRRRDTCCEPATEQP